MLMIKGIRKSLEYENNILGWAWWADSVSADTTASTTTTTTQGWFKTAKQDMKSNCINLCCVCRLQRQRRLYHLDQRMFHLVASWQGDRHTVYWRRNWLFWCALKEHSIPAIAKLWIQVHGFEKIQQWQDAIICECDRKCWRKNIYIAGQPALTYLKMIQKWRILFGKLVLFLVVFPLGL